mmetsp:Transcript_186/g.424  ORF Transcript_186/g.424 Transcript_186/m.424 type:complete len:271 (+) Transcript_186:471-1283(+)
MKLDNGSLGNQALISEQFSIPTCSIPCQRQPIDGIHSSKNSWQGLRQVVGEHPSIALASCIDATHVDAILPPENGYHSLDEGDVVVAGRPITPSALALDLAGCVARILCCRDVFESAFLAALGETSLGIAAGTNIPSSTKIQNGSGLTIVVSREVVSFGVGYVEGFCVAHEAQAHWKNRDPTVVVRATPVASGSSKSSRLICPTAVLTVEPKHQWHWFSSRQVAHGVGDHDCIASFDCDVHLAIPHIDAPHEYLAPLAQRDAYSLRGAPG